jgi:hypothetical protein
MRADIATKWIDRLRNGNIPQTSDALGTKDGERCCLGVLCDIAVEDGIIAKPTEFDGEPALKYADHWSILPDAVMQWAGMASDTGSLRNTDSVYSDKELTELNDTGMPFSEIADVIESNYDKI